MRLATKPLLRSVAWLLVLALASAAQVDPKKYLEHIKYLASDELKGRGSGTPELEKAAAYIADQFRAFGLRPPGAGGYLQPLTVTVNAHLGSRNHLSYRSAQQPPQDLALETDFQPFNFSSSQSVRGPVVFVGYGITAPEYHYDDYAGVNVQGKIVLLLRHEPQEFDEHSVFAGRVYTLHSQFPSKAANARLHGASAVILINDTPNHPGEIDGFESFGSTVGPPNAGLPFVQVKAAVAEGWLASASRDLQDITAQIDKSLRPRSFALSGDLQVSIESDVEGEVRTVHNVAAYLPGATPEYVILGAHYDHLGLGAQYSMAPTEIGSIHHGADDNASGTAGVLELARHFAARPRARRGVLFLTFASEELGLLGSSFYVSHPELPLDQAVAMMNLDMIGRIREGKVFVGGSGAGSAFKDLVARLAPHPSLHLEFSGQGDYGSSDHTSFTTKQVPVLFFFSGLHADYHRPSDTWDKIDAAQAAQLLNLIADLTTHLVEAPARPQLARVAEPQPPMAGQPLAVRVSWEQRK